METASIIIASRNHEVFLAQAIESALAQTVATEVVVVDDGSDDGSRDVIQSFGKRIVPVFQTWSGQASAINAGIAKASGSILFLLDCDDLADSNRVATLMPLFEADRSLLWVRHGLRAVDDINRVVVDNLYRFGNTHHQISSQVLHQGKTPGTTSGLVFRRSFFDHLGLIPEHYKAYPDCYLLIRGALVGHGASVETPLGAHRWHGGAFTAYDWRQFERAPFHLALRRFLADDARSIAEMQGLRTIAEGRTWWQMKAKAEWQKATNGNAIDGNLMVLYGQFLRATVSSPLPAKQRCAQFIRGALLGLVPAPLFHRAWWMTHVGRPTALRPKARK